MFLFYLQAPPNLTPYPPNALNLVKPPALFACALAC